MPTQTRYVPALALSVFVGATIAVAADAPGGSSRAPEDGATPSHPEPANAVAPAGTTSSPKPASDEPVRAP